MVTNCSGNIPSVPRFRYGCGNVWKSQRPQVQNRHPGHSACAVVAIAQTPPKPIKSSYYLESWTGQTGKEDQIDHKPVGKGNILACVDVQPRDGSILGCHIRLENGNHYDLTFRQSINSPDTDVAYLTCNTKPPTGIATTYCKLSVSVLADKK